MKSVTHTFDYEQGFSTTAQVMAPMSVSRAPLNRIGNDTIDADDIPDMGGWF